MIDNCLNRLSVKRGEDLPHSKLTVDKVREARQLHTEYLDTVKKLTDEFCAKGLARRYGVHVRTMERALSGETWSHIA